MVRVMPNTPCLVGQTAAAFAMGETTVAEDQVITKRIFSAVGLALEVKEKDLNGRWGRRWPVAKCITQDVGPVTCLPPCSGDGFEW